MLEVRQGGITESLQGGTQGHNRQGPQDKRGTLHQGTHGYTGAGWTLPVRTTCLITRCRMPSGKLQMFQDIAGLPGHGS
jgi:hypothetical protein